MRNLIRKDIPGLGTVTFGSITVGMIIEAHNVTEQAEESDQANAFANFVLASMFVEPQKIPEDIDRFPADTLIAVIEVAVDKLQISEYFETSSEDLPVRERFFKAYLKHEQELFEGLSTAINQNLEMFTIGFQNTFEGLFREVGQMASVSRQIVGQFSKLSVPVPVVDFRLPAIDVSSWARALSVSDSIVRLVQPVFEVQDALAEQVQKMLHGFDDTMRRISANLAAATISVEQTISLGVFDNLIQLIQARQDAVEAFKAAGWPIAPSMPSDLIERVVAMHKQGKTQYISRTIIGHYQRNSHQYLIETVESWKSHPLFAPRMHILNDALQAHCRGMYTLSVPALVPQIEGVLNDYVLTNGLVAKFGKIQQVYEAAIGDVDEYGLSKWVIASTLLYQLQTNTYVFTDFEIELKKSVNTRQVTRHTVSHGVALKYDRPIHSLKAFLLLDALSALQEL
ncbi:MAG: hypothetical protein JRI67_11760 [Deltaproteobacteria bacterium]|nr:hypothetical protein [Deltaproteobacteria bacterium]